MMMLESNHTAENIAIKFPAQRRSQRLGVACSGGVVVPLSAGAAVAVGTQ